MERLEYLGAIIPENTGIPREFMGHDIIMNDSRTVEIEFEQAQVGNNEMASINKDDGKTPFDDVMNSLNSLTICVAVTSNPDPIILILNLTLTPIFFQEDQDTRHNLTFDQLEEIDRLVDEIDHGDEVDDLPVVYRFKSMFLPKFLKRRLTENLEFKISRRRLIDDDEGDLTD